MSRWSGTPYIQRLSGSNVIIRTHRHTQRIDYSTWTTAVADDISRAGTGYVCFRMWEKRSNIEVFIHESHREEKKMSSWTSYWTDNPQVLWWHGDEDRWKWRSWWLLPRSAAPGAPFISVHYWYVSFHLLPRVWLVVLRIKLPADDVRVLEFDDVCLPAGCRQRCWRDATIVIHPASAAAVERALYTSSS